MIVVEKDNFSYVSFLKSNKLHKRFKESIYKKFYSLKINANLGSPNLFPLNYRGRQRTYFLMEKIQYHLRKYCRKLDRDRFSLKLCVEEYMANDSVIGLRDVRTYSITYPSLNVSRALCSWNALCMYTHITEDTNLLFIMHSQYRYNTAYTIM
jgi:hypothetical protein